MNWKKASESEIHGTYQTDIGNLICSCPAYLQNEFLICKRLVAGAAVPKYRGLERYTKPPFIRIQLVEDRLFPDVNGESNCSTLVETTPTISPPALDLQPSGGAGSLSVDDVRSEILELLEWAKTIV